VWLATDEPEEIYTAIGIGSSAKQKAPVLLRRRADARNARFVTVYDLSAEDRYIAGLKQAKGDLPKIDVKTTDGDWSIEFNRRDVVIASP
jgi:hypothetical protein